MKKLLFLLLLAPTIASAQLELPFGIKVLDSVAVDYWYGPYESVAAANAAVPEAVRANRTVKIGSVEYWWNEGTDDEDLVLKIAPDGIRTVTLRRLVSSFGDGWTGDTTSNFFFEDFNKWGTIVKVKFADPYIDTVDYPNETIKIGLYSKSDYTNGRFYYYTGAKAIDIDTAKTYYMAYNVVGYNQFILGELNEEEGNFIRQGIFSVETLGGVRYIGMCSDDSTSIVSKDGSWTFNDYNSNPTSVFSNYITVNENNTFTGFNTFNNSVLFNESFNVGTTFGTSPPIVVEDMTGDPSGMWIINPEGETAISTWEGSIYAGKYGELYRKVAFTDIVEDNITDGDTTTAPSENAVYDALALKADVDDAWPLSGDATVTTDVDISGTKNIKIRSTVASAAAGFHLGTNSDVSLFSGGLATDFASAGSAIKVLNPNVIIKGTLQLDTVSATEPALFMPGGALLTTKKPGSIENDGSNLYYTDDDSTRYQVASIGSGGTGNSVPFFYGYDKKLTSDAYFTYDSSSGKLTASSIELDGNLSSSGPLLKIASKTLLSEELAGSVENDGNHIYYTDDSGSRHQLDQQVSLTLASGTYTPTVTSGDNVASYTAHELYYTRIGDVVDVAGYITVNWTTGGTNTKVSLSLPPGVTPNFTSITELAGSGTVPGSDNVVQIYADPSTDLALVSFTSGSVGSGAQIQIHFKCKIP